MGEDLYEKILDNISAIILSEKQRDKALNDIAVLLKNEVFHYDWVGFYILDESENGLELGPFSGAPTQHTFIPVGKGICGQVALNKEEMIVQDVSQVENYLSCSIDVQSEIVVPILKNNKFVAEIDIDSHSPAPFGDFDLKLLKNIGEKLVQYF